MLQRGNGERTLEMRPYTDVQVEEKRVGGMVQDVKVPRTQAAWVALAAMAICLFAPVAVRALGQMIFWLVVFVVGSGTFVYALYVSVRYEQAIEGGASLYALLTGGAFALLAGGVGLALWQVAEMALPVWSIESQFVNFLLALPFVGSLVFFALMALTFTQELAYRSPFLEKALGSLMTQKDAPFWANRERKSEPVPEPSVVRVEYAMPQSPNAGKSVVNFDLPVTEAKMRQVTQRVMQGAPFSEPGLAGRGQPLSGPQFRELRDTMLENGFAAWVNADNHFGGVELTGPGNAFIRRFAEFNGGNERPTSP